MIIELVLKGSFTSIVVLLGLILSLWVILSDAKSTLNRILFFLINLSGLYILLDYLSSFTNLSVATTLLRLAYGCGILAVAVFYYFSVYFPFHSRARIYTQALVLLVCASTCLLTVFTNLVVKATQNVSWGLMVDEGLLLGLYYVILVFVLMLGFLNILKKYSNSNATEKRKINILLIGIIIFALAQVIFTVVLPYLGVGEYYFIGDYSMIVFSFMAAYAIVRHGLFDVRLAIVRSVSYVLILATLAGIYASIAFAFSVVFNRGPASVEQTVIGVISSILMALLVQPLKRFFDKVTNRIFYKDNYNTDDFFARLNKTLSVTTDLRGLLERVSYEIATTLKADQAFFFIYTTAEGNYITAGTEHHKLLPKVDAILIERLCSGKDDIILVESLKDNHPVKRMMISHRIELILPLIQDAEVIGFLCLGEHKNSGYTHRDVRTLDTIADELIIAIKNALAVHEIRELNLGLQQKIANATKELRSNNRILKQLDKVKDEFISMASHQLRTPLTSVKGYLSMVLDGDAGKITDTQKQLLNQAFNSSENMVVLINDFLNVSRIQTGKFVIEKTPVNMADLVEHEVNVLLPNAKARKMNLVYKKPKDFPITMVDEGKIRQVVMNFSDNAVYYSRENTDINIDLVVEGNNIVFTVKDHGIGVPAKQKDQLFGKFFRADNARVKRPDGTGVGLYLAKKVVDAQGGQIIFDSIEGQGSTFGFKLPIITPDQPDESSK